MGLREQVSPRNAKMGCEENGASLRVPVDGRRQTLAGCVASDLHRHPRIHFPLFFRCVFVCRALFPHITIEYLRPHLLFLLSSRPQQTGKTMMAKAVANATTASFISCVGSEFVQKYLGEG